MIDNLTDDFDYNGLLEKKEISLSSVLQFIELKFHRIRFLSGLKIRFLDPAEELPRPLVGWGGDNPLSLSGVERSSGAPALWSA